MTITRNEFKELVELFNETQNDDKAREVLDWIIDKLGFGVDNPFDDLREMGKGRMRVRNKDKEILPGLYAWHWEFTNDLDKLYDYWFTPAAAE